MQIGKNCDQKPSKRIGHFEREAVLTVIMWITVPVIAVITVICIENIKFAIKEGKAKKTAVAQVATQDSTPAVSLFSSVERVKVFLEKEAKLDYSDKFLSGVKLTNVESIPKRGQAWVYSFSFKKPRLGGDIVIYHYMDGELIEFECGP